MAKLPLHINSCEIPQRAREVEARLYAKFHTMHCDRRNEPDHKCAGRVTVDRNGVTMSCPLCGDSRKVYA